MNLIDSFKHYYQVGGKVSLTGPSLDPPFIIIYCRYGDKDTNSRTRTRANGPTFQPLLRKAIRYDILILLNIITN
jgi:hypothetical protein